MKMFKKNSLMSISNLLKGILMIEIARFAMEEIKMITHLKNKMMKKFQSNDLFEGEDDA